MISQTTITGLVTDSLNKPIPFATVCLLKTTFGTSTDNYGRYTLKIPQDGYYQLLASSVGFNSIERNIYADGQKLNIDIKLSVNYYTLNEVTIKASDGYKRKYYRLFIKQFIGDTHNSLSCTILNPEDLQLYKVAQNDILKGFSIKPLKIENKALGYTILYDLTDFSFDIKSGILKFAGNHYFQPLEGSSNKIKKWNLNRLFAYYGSRMHFIRSLYADSLFKDGFKLSEFELDTINKENLEFKTLQDSDVVFSNNQISKTFFYKKSLLIRFTDNHPELVYSPYGYVANIYTSSVVFSDSIRIYKNGLFENPFSATWDGAMTTERLADMLPFDYWPNQIEADKNNALGEKSLIKDQVFVHTDRNLYRPGDTIYFQAYIRDKITGEFESASTSLYTLLFNEQEEMADSSRFKIENAASSGWMVIPISANSGLYHFVAFTSMMQNDDPKDAFQIDLRVESKAKDPRKAAVSFSKAMYLPGDTIEATIKITDLKEEPVHNQQFKSTLQFGKSSIELEESHTDRKGESTVRFTIPDTIMNTIELQIEMNKKSDNSSIIKNFIIPYNDQSLDLRFLAEGGNLIEGLEQRIGFNATNKKGESIYIKGLLKTSNGIIIDTIRSGDYGPGLFTCKPEKGMYVELINMVYEKKIWSLPNFSKSDIILGVKPINNRSFAVQVQSNNYNGETVFVAGNMNNSQIFLQEIKLDKKKRITINTNELPAGVVQISLLDAAMKPIAERLIYVNADKHLKFNISTDTTVYTPGQETELTISVTNGQDYPESGSFSISVANAISGNDAEIFTPGIEYAFNYNPYFANNLPPKVLLDGLENLSEEQRDLLLMVYGWSKIHRNSDIDSMNKPPINYDLLNMKLLYAIGKRKSDRKITLVSLEGLSTKKLVTDDKGEISISLNSLSDVTRSILLMPDIKNKKRVKGGMKSGQFGDQNLLELLKRKRVWGVKLDIPNNTPYFKSENLLTQIPGIPIKEFIKSKSFYDISTGDSLLEIPEVTISGYTKRTYNDPYEEYFKNDFVLSLSNESLWSLPSLLAAVRKLAPMAETDDFENIILEPYSKYPFPAYIILDGNPVNAKAGTWTRASKIIPSNLKSLTVYRKFTGVIFLNSLKYDHDPKLAKRYNDWAIKSKKDKLLLPITVYRPYKEYYNPTKAELDINPTLQDRATIFWDPEVFCDVKEPVKIKFPNTNHQGPVLITINGVSFNNLAGTGRAGYKVQKKIH